jgi:hypothetical protein
MFMGYISSNEIYTYLLDVTGLKMIAGLLVLGYPLVI